MIDPNTNINGEEFESYNIRRWGSSSWTHSLIRQGRSVGANFTNWVVWPNTLRAHQLINYVVTHHNPNQRDEKVDVPSLTSECNAAIFHAMYECGANVSLVDTLVNIGIEKLGIPVSKKEELRTHLETNAGSKAVMNEIQLGRKRYNISGVPYFIVGAVITDDDENDGPPRIVGKSYEFSGAQESDAFVNMFNELAKRLE
jgi:predicted DsbA family dithiol-disulfide isomerase